LILRERAGNVEQQPAGDYGGAGTLNRGGDRDADAELHVGGLELEPAVFCAEEDAGQRLDCASGRGGANGDAELPCERFAIDRELHVT
jgi:hypothetical protein